MRDFPKVVMFADALAKAGQILDDLQDINEDLQRNRFNYASIYILRRKRKARLKSRNVADHIADTMIFTDCVNTLFDEISAQLQLAQKAIKPLQLSAAEKYFDEYREMLADIKRFYHRERMAIIFQGEASTLLKKQ
jgi:hypothetical protein